MSQMVVVEVHPDTDGGWSVTRDRVIDGYFPEQHRAEAYARMCVERARASGAQAKLVIHQALPQETAQP